MLTVSVPKHRISPPADLHRPVFVLTVHPRADFPTTLDFREEGKQDNVYTARKVSLLLSH